MGCIKINRRLLFLGKVSRQAYALRVTGLGFYGIWGFCKHRVFIMVWPDLKKVNNKRRRSWGTRSLSPQASELGPGLCPSCVPCYRHLLGIILMQNDSNLFTKKPPWWLLWWLSVCFFKWSLREKLFPQRPHLCFLSPVWILKCLCNSSDLNKRYFWKEWNFPKNILTWWISWHSRANCKDRAGPQCASAGELEGEKSSCRSFHSWDSGTGAW